MQIFVRFLPEPLPPSGLYKASENQRDALDVSRSVCWGLETHPAMTVLVTWGKDGWALWNLFSLFQCLCDKK